MLLTLTMGIAAAPAQAYTCSGTRHVRVNGDVSQLDYYFSPSCSDGRSHIWGTIYDVACDSRQAYGFMSIQHQELPHSPWYAVWNTEVHADNGCGTSSTFSRSGPVPLTYPYTRWRVESFTWAENGWGASSLTFHYLYQ
jgi:hypothetical protein